MRLGFCMSLGLSSSIAIGKEQDLIKKEGLEKAKTIIDNAQQINLNSSGVNSLFSKMCDGQDQSVDIKIGNKNEKSQILVFVSNAMPMSLIKDYYEQATELGASLVVRGFKDASFVETSKWLSNFTKEDGAGVLIDPPSFRKYKIEEVPAIVLDIGKASDKIYGNISIKYALSIFEKEGDTRENVQDSVEGKK